MALVSRGIGAYFSCIWIVTFERPLGVVWMFLTLPTDTPEMRTSASLASCVASPNDVWKRYPFGESGIGPPKASHRNSSRPKHERAKPTITSIRPRVGACFCMPYRPLLLAAPAAAGGGVAGGVPVPAPAWLGHASRSGLGWLLAEQ